MTSYPVSMVTEARRLAAGGWTVSEIRRLFASRGQVAPSRGTIHYWINDDYAECRREALRRQMTQRTARTATFRLSSNTPEYRMAFVKACRDEGVPLASIARVCKVVFGEQISSDTLRRRLEEQTA